MKGTEFGEIVRLARRVVERELNGGEELMTDGAFRKAARKASPGSDSGAKLCEFEKEISGCTKCRLGETRIKFVFGEGNPRAELMFVGEGPGYDEDHQGRPFVGRAGQLLTKIIESIGYKRQDVFIANLVKCHPMKDPSDREKRGNDRAPAPDEISTCFPYLERQIEIIRPRIICALGSYAAKTLLATEEGIGALRGKFRLFHETTLMPTYHPAALLRNPALKKDVWEDMKLIRAELKKKPE